MGILFNPHKIPWREGYGTGAIDQGSRMPKSQDLTLLIAGDVRVVRENPPAAFQNVQSLLHGADFTLVNLEGSMSDSGRVTGCSAQFGTRFVEHGDAMCIAVGAR
jgi:hypothetical protein